MKNVQVRPVSLYILLTIILFQGLSGMLGGLGLVLDPTGKSLSIPVAWLENSPFSDYLIPGLILFCLVTYVLDVRLIVKFIL